MFDLFEYSISQRAHDLTMLRMSNSAYMSNDGVIASYLENYNEICNKLRIDAIRNADDDQFKD